LNRKINTIQNRIKKEKRVMVALSGGVDSSLLLFFAQNTLPGKVVAITAASPFVSPGEIAYARKVTRTLKVPHIITTVQLLQDTDIRHNARDRCYLCKHRLFTHFLTVADIHHATIIEATNFNDIKDFRPGLKALKELNILSPFIRARLVKSEIRTLARRYGLSAWNKPANACLATRIPYDTHITEELLQRIDRAESYLRRLGFPLVRVRDHAGVARIETEPKRFPHLLQNTQRIVRYLKRLGYSFVTVDLEGYRSGSFK
jgi:uncharacterized protein